MKPQNQPIRPNSMLLLALAAVYLCWGSTYLAIRVALETIPPFILGGIRHLSAGGLLYAVMRLYGAEKPSGTHWKNALVGGVFLILLGNGAVIWAEQRVASGLAALIVAVTPLFMVCFASLQRNAPPVGLFAVFGIIGGTLGVAILVQPWKMGQGAEIAPLDLAALLLASLSWAAGSVYSRTAELPKSLFLCVGMQALCGGSILFALSIVSGEWIDFDLGRISPQSLIAAGYLVVAGSVIGFTAYVYTLKYASAALASTYAYVNPLIAVFLGWLIIGEVVNKNVFFAAILIILSVAAVGFKRGSMESHSNLRAILHRAVLRVSRSTRRPRRI